MRACMYVVGRTNKTLSSLCLQLTKACGDASHRYCSSSAFICDARLSRVGGAATDSQHTHTHTHTQRRGREWRWANRNVEREEVSIEQHWIVHKRPLAARVLITVSANARRKGRERRAAHAMASRVEPNSPIALAREVQPLWMPKFVADEIEISLAP